MGGVDMQERRERSQAWAVPLRVPIHTTNY